jgi:hypothetical protein
MYLKNKIIFISSETSKQLNLETQSHPVTLRGAGREQGGSREGAGTKRSTATSLMHDEVD